MVVFSAGQEPGEGETSECRWKGKEMACTRDGGETTKENERRKRRIPLWGAR